MINGFAVIVTRSRLLGPPVLSCRVQVALTLVPPQMMSATVFVVAPLQRAEPAFVAGPQSLSVTRMIASDARVIDLLNSIASRSPVSSVFENPAEVVSVADVDRGASVSAMPGMF